MPAYNYFECPTCMAAATDIPKQGKYRIAIEKPIVNVLASPRCGKCAKTMRHIGSGDAPFAPPSTAFVMPPSARLNATETEIAAGRGPDTTGREISYKVFENVALNRVRLSIEVDGGTVIASLVRNQLIKGNLARPESWLVRPPFAIAAGPDVWAKLDIEAMRRIQVANVLPRVFEIRMCLGCQAFGLIHLLAGHYRNTRTWIGTHNPSPLSPPASTRDIEGQRRYEQQHLDDESYRTIQGIQRALNESLTVSAMQKVIRSTGNKYILIGAFANGPAKIVVQDNGGTFTVTTMYINDRSETNANLRSGEAIVWSRPAHLR